MMMNNTLAQLRALKLVGMTAAIEEQLSSSASMTLSFEERLALMVDRETHHRGDRRRAALLKRAGLKYPQACIEDVDGRAGRGFERAALMSLALSRWIEEGQAILITGAKGSGKSWLGCALAQYACRRGQSALYLRTPRLAEELPTLHARGACPRGPPPAPGHAALPTPPRGPTPPARVPCLNAGPTRKLHSALYTNSPPTVTPPTLPLPASWRRGSFRPPSMCKTWPRPGCCGASASMTL